MNPVEDRFHAALSAAADQAAREIPAAPPLRLPPEPAAGDRRRHTLRRPTQRRWIRWAAPLAAAAAVVALGVAPVLVKHIAPAGTATSAVPKGVPRYYVALKLLSGDVTATEHEGIVVGDALTGKTLATFAPPAHMGFRGVIAAADDRTFVAFAMTASTTPPNTVPPPNSTKATGAWYKVRLDPGSAVPARLSRLPIKPRTVQGSDNWGTASDELVVSDGAALSSSGAELAVPVLSYAPHEFAVQVFSVATGRLLHDWTTTDWSLGWEPSLTWLAGDRKLALLSRYNQPAKTQGHDKVSVTVREWPVAGSASGDLLAASKVAWDLETESGAGPRTPLLQSCSNPPGGGPVLISADGKTISCATSESSAADQHLGFYTYPLTASTTATAKGTVDYQVTLPIEHTADFPHEEVFYMPQVLWTSPSGDTLIGALLPSSKGPNLGLKGLRIGVISHGKFTPLRFPQGFAVPASGTPHSYLVSPYSSMAW